jgi:hypothetical protein
MVGGLWGIEPLGTRVTQPVAVSLPNVSALPPGQLAVILTHDATRHVLQRGGFGRVSEDGSVIQGLEPISLGSLDFIGYQALSEEQSSAVAKALGLGGGTAPAAPSDVGTTGLLQMREDPATRLRRALLWPFGGIARAQVGTGLVGFYSGFAALDAIGGPGFAYVRGKIRTPQERRIEIQLGLGISQFLGIETRVKTPYVLAVDATAKADDPSQVISVKLDAYRNGVPYPPIDGGVQARPSDVGPVPGVGQAMLAGRLPLLLGDNDITISASQGLQGPPAVDSQGQDDQTVHLRATLSRSQADGGTDEAYLTVNRTASTDSSAEAVDAVTGAASGISFFKSWPVEVSSSTTVKGTSGTYGQFYLPVFSYGRSQTGLACTEANTGTRWLTYKEPAPGGGQRVSFQPVTSGYPICTPVFSMSPGSSSPVSLLVDMRLIAGAVKFLKRDGTAVAGACDTDAQTEYDQETKELRSISLDDVATTELHFFRDDNLQEPIARFSVAVPGYTRDANGTG